MARYVLLPMQARTAADVVDGAPFPTCGRPTWNVRLRVGAIEAAGSVTVTLEGSPDGADETWTELGTFGATTAVGDFPLEGSVPDVALAVHMRFLRARRTNQVGDAVYEVVADSPFLHASDDHIDALLGKRARQYEQGIDRLIGQAEADVLELLQPDPYTGELQTDHADSPLFYDTVRRGIAAQVEHLLEIDRLRRANDPSAKATLRALGRYGAGARDAIRGFQRSADMTWRHR